MDKKKALILEAESYITHQKSEPVKLRNLSDTPEHFLITVPQMFRQACEKYNNRAALSWEEGENNWKVFTYTEYLEKANTVAKSLIKMKFKRFDTFGLIAFNCPEWAISFHGAISAGLIVAGIYETSSPDIVKHIILNSGTVVILVDSKIQLDKVLEIWEEVPTLKTVITLGFKANPVESRHIVTWEDFLEIGKDVADSVLDEVVYSLPLNSCASVIYTSGTTGPPKGAMLTHYNIVSLQHISTISCPNFLCNMDHHRLISYLPLSHAASQALDLNSALYLGATIYFARRDALKGSLPITLKHVRPTLFLGVPRVYEKMRDKVLLKIQSKPSIVQSMINSAMNMVRNSGCVGMAHKNSASYTIGSIITKKILAELGFDQLTGGMVGAAPVPEKLSWFMRGLGINICESYGLSEMYGPVSGNLPENHVDGSVGEFFKFVKCDLAKVPDRTDDYELCLSSPTTFMGYLGEPTKTQQSFNENFYFLTGDLGRIDKSGHVFITGRIKELIITAGGENIAPIPIEEQLIQRLPFISNVMVVGDQKPFLSVLFTLKTKPNLQTMEPTDELLEECVFSLKKYGINGYDTASSLISKAPEAFLQCINSALQNVNDMAVNNASRVNKYLFVLRDFSISGGELGATMKLRRNFIMEKYKDEIDNLYQVAAAERKA